MSQAAFVSRAALAAAAPEWADLCARAAEPNPFAEPGFLLPLLAYERPKRPCFVLAREDSGRLIGFAALILPRFGLARGWMSPYAALPARAFDRDAAPAALAALLRLIAERTRLAGIVWPLVEQDGPFAAALRAATGPRPCVEAGRTRRVALRVAGVAAFEASLKRRHTNWARQTRRLAALGKLDEAAGPSAIAAFLDVERKGWKGARRTALADDPARLAFAKAAFDAFADAGRLDALALRLNGAPIAAGLVFIAGARAFYWKAAYDEAYAKGSPGVQVTLALSRRLTARPDLQLVDSCAGEDHPMIGRVWSDALEFEEIALGLRPEGGRPLIIWMALERAKARIRAALKRSINRARGRRR